MTENRGQITGDRSLVSAIKKFQMTNHK
jgi:hypothetical protein